MAEAQAVQGGLYAMFGSSGAVIFVATVIALGLLAYFVREHGRPGFPLALAAAVLFALALVLWWVLVYPVNVELAKWVNGPVPADWTEYRARWEWGHAIIALVELIGFAALPWSALTATPRGPPASALSVPIQALAVGTHLVRADRHAARTDGQSLISPNPSSRAFMASTALRSARKAA